MDDLIDKDFLYNLYVIKKFSLRKIGKLIHRRSEYVSKMVDYYGFPRLETKKHCKADEQTANEWVRLYVDEQKSSTEIAELYNVRHKTVLNTLIRIGVERRSLADSHRAKNNKEPYDESLQNYSAMYDLYVTQRKTLNDLGEMYNCAPHVIRRRLVDLNIPIRTQTEVKIGLLTGKDHPNWKGGITSLCARLREYFDTNQSPKIRERDNFTCQLCGGHSNLHVHHIRSFSDIVNEIILEHPNLDPEADVNELYDICTNDERFNDENNLITYCKDCHFYKIHKYNKTISSEAS